MSAVDLGNYIENHQAHTDKYFLRTKKILEAEDINPEVTIRIFARDEGPLTDRTRDEFLKVFAGVSERDVSVRWRNADTYGPGDTLAQLEGPIQDLVDLETVYLGVLSHELTTDHREHDHPDAETFRENVEKCTNIFDEIDVPVLYFGARHYHPDQDYDLAGAALEGGCKQTSTDVGSSHIGEEGVGTTPHILTLILAHEFSREDATVKTAELFDKHMEEDVPRTILIDTFNREIFDAYRVCREVQDHSEATFHFRVDTCGENLMQSNIPDPGYSERSYQFGNGVRTFPLQNLRMLLLSEGYEDCNIFLSSGFGNPDKAREFVEAAKQFEKRTSEPLFHGVGAGNFYDSVQCTADLVLAEGEPMTKTGRSFELLNDDNSIQVQ